MALAGTHRDVRTSVVSMALGFGALIASNFRVAALASEKADEVRDALVAAARDTAAKAETIKGDLAAADLSHARELAETKAAALATLAIVEAERDETKRKLAEALAGKRIG